MSKKKKKTKRKNKSTPNKPPHRALTDLQKKMVDNYHSMRKPCKGKALEAAGSTMRGRTAIREATRLFQLPHVEAYHKSLQKKATENAVKSEADIIAEMELLAFSNIRDYLSFGSGGVTLKNSDELTAEQLACISEISETTTQHGGRVTFKLYDKKGALELLGRRFGCFPTKVDFGDQTIQSLADIVAIMMGKDGSKDYNRD
jgi:phage terminase small subunit